MANINNHQSDTFLLHGITGSGKTEVYLQLIKEVLDKGQDAIVLVPEIALTPQMVDRFKSRFGDEVAVLHSGLSNGERYDEWRKIKMGKHVYLSVRVQVYSHRLKISALLLSMKSMKQLISRKTIHDTMPVKLRSGVRNIITVHSCSAVRHLRLKVMPVQKRVYIRNSKC